MSAQKALLRFRSLNQTPELEFAIGFARSNTELKQSIYEALVASLLRLQKLKPKE